MNLIEKLGGYEKAREKYKQRLFDLAWSDLAATLLEYRREKNIFEVGDKVVIKAEPFWPEDCAIETVEQEHIGKWYMSAWRHATDAEIKAGHRL